MKIEIDNKIIKKAKKVFDGNFEMPTNEKEWQEWIEEILLQHISSWDDLAEE